MIGQVVIVEQVVGDHASDVRHVLAAARRAVLVPWDHDSGCEPIPWMAKPLWIAPATVGFVAATLRPRDRWAGGLPTFDVRDAWREPYTAARATAALGTLAASRSIMTPAEFGSFSAALPTTAEWRRDLASALTELFTWERDHPALAAKEPAATMLAGMHRAARDRR
jgi:hypothetical protein